MWSLNPRTARWLIRLPQAILLINRPVQISEIRKTYCANTDSTLGSVWLFRRQSQRSPPQHHRYKWPLWCHMQCRTHLNFSFATPLLRMFIHISPRYHAIDMSQVILIMIVMVVAFLFSVADKGSYTAPMNQSILWRTSQCLTSRHCLRHCIWVLFC